METPFWSNVDMTKMPTEIKEQIILEYLICTDDPLDIIHVYKHFPRLAKTYAKLVYIDWGYTSIYKTLSEDFIREFQHKVCWYFISFDQTLSEEFIKEFQSKVYWKGISWKQTLSEDFIRKFEHKVDWSKISEYQKVSEDFIREFQHKVYWERLLKNEKVDDNIKNRVKNLFK